MLFNLKVLAYLDVLLLIGLMGFRQVLPPSARSLIRPKVVALVLLTPAVALLSGNIYIFHAYLIGAIGFTSRTRRELCCTYLLMLPMVPAVQFDLFFGSVYVFAATSFLSMNLGAVLGMMLTRGGTGRADPMLDLSMFLFLAVLSFIAIRDITATAMLRVLLQNALLVLPPYLLVSRSARTAEDVRELFLYVYLAAFLGSIVAIFGMLRSWDLYEPFFGALNLVRPMGSTAIAVRGGFMRMGGPFDDYSAYGLFLAAIIACLPAFRQSFSKIGFPVVTGVLLAGLFTTQSRGAWIGLLVGFVVFQWLRDRRAMAAAVVAGGTAAYLLLSTVLAPTSRFSETLGVSGSAVGTGDYRWRLLNLGLEQVAAHPLLGQTPDALEASLAELVQGQHIIDFVNTHLFIAMSTGVFGFAIWAVIWIAIVVRLASRSRREPLSTRRSGLSMVPVAMIVSSGVGLTFTSMIDRNLYWMLLGAAFATPFLAPRRTVAANAESPAGRSQASQPLVARLG
jgi:hypothetical protein